MDLDCTIDGSAKVSKRLDLNVRHLFPWFAENPDLIFFDNASTTQKPQDVIDTIDNYYRRNCSNAGRAVYQSSLQAAQLIEEARRAVAGFINAQANEIAFTGGATDSLNHVAWSWGLHNLKDGDEILLCLQDHASAVSPWFNLQQTMAKFATRIRIVPFEIQSVGDYDLRSIANALSQRSRVIALSHVHHVFGQDMQIREIKEILGPDVIVSLDACQSVSHTAVNVAELAADFVSFSGHKMFAGNGTGVLFAKAEHHENIIATRAGGKMASLTGRIGSAERSQFIEKIEGGTPNIPSILSLTKAIDFIEKIGFARIEEYVSDLTDQLMDRLSGLDGIRFSPGPFYCKCPGGFGIVSFCFEQVSNSDLADALANESIQVRSGVSCQTEASEEFIRISMHLYNTPEEIEIVSETIKGLIS